MNFYIEICLYIFFGLLPSLIWLFYYLRKDVHPESNLMILKIFFWGAFATIPVFFLQMGLENTLEKIYMNPVLYSVIYWFVVIAFSEEFFKYLVIKLKVINNPELDEPMDLMIYMVISALGFTAVENILYIFTPTGQFSFQELIGRTLQLSFVRFIGATFLHTLCSAVIGYALSVAICKAKNRSLYIAIGLFMATALHGLYDLSIITLEGNLAIIVPVLILMTLAIVTSLGFEDLKGLKGICKISNINNLNSKR